MKIVIETNGNDVYVNGGKQNYAKHYPLTIEDKVLVSVADAVGYEPANCLVLDNIDWDDFGQEEE